MRAVEVCRTAALGGHVEKCGQCDYTRISYNSCRNRHCPKCQNSERAKWLADRKAELLPVEYFHVVFTIPEELARIAFYNKEGSTAFSSGPLRKRFLLSRAIRGASARRSDSSRSCIPGDKTYSIIPMSTVSCRAAVLRPVMSAGSAASRGSFCPCVFYRVCSAASFSKLWKMPSIEESCCCSGRRNHFRMPLPFTP